MISLLISITLLGAGKEIEDPRAFFETLYAPIQDVKFQFEGSVEQFLPRRNEWHLENEFSGSLAYRKGMSLKSVTSNQRLDYDAKDRKTVRRSWFLDDGKATGYYDGPPGVETYSFPGESSLVMDMTLVYPTGSDILLVPYLIRSTANDFRRFYQKGTEKIGDVECDLITCEVRSDITNEVLESRKIWLDTKRGGQPLRYEITDSNGEVRYRIDEIVLKDFPAGGSKRIWLPISATHRSFVTSESIQMEGMPPNLKRGDTYRRHTNRILIGTVTINEGIEDSEFVPRRTNGERITD